MDRSLYELIEDVALIRPSSSRLPQTMLSPSNEPHTMLSPSKNPTSSVPHTMFEPQTMFVPHTMSSPQTMLLLQTTFEPATTFEPQTMLSPSLSAQARLSLSPDPQTMFGAHACWLTVITSTPVSTFVPQMTCCAHATFSVP